MSCCGKGSARAYELVQGRRWYTCRGYQLMQNDGKLKLAARDRLGADEDDATMLRTCSFVLAKQ
jgi:hypothetical protein